MSSRQSVSTTAHLHHQDALRRWAWMLGLAGLIPFVAHVIIMWHYDAPPGPTLAAASQIQYAAVIISFLGALHWGLALADPDRFAGRLAPMLVWSVLPAIFAWAAAQLTQHRALTLLIAALVVIFAVDWRLYRSDPDLRWFIGLRLTLTVGAAVCLLATWLLLGR